MGFFIFVYICNLLIPSVMLIAGYFMNKNIPKEMNGLVGYRTERSQKNKDTWSFAHNYCGKLWMKAGLILLVVSALVQLPFVHATEKLLGIGTIVLETIQIVVLILSIIVVEKELKRTFDENGHRRKKE